MKNLGSKIIPLTAILYVLASTAAFASNSVSISEPADGAKISGPVKTCLATSGVTVEPAKRGVHDGKGHHHILVDVDVPGDLSKPIGKDTNHIHMGDGSTCKELKLGSGKHVIRTLFANGGHVPYSPAITSTVIVTVK